MRNSFTYVPAKHAMSLVLPWTVVKGQTAGKSETLTTFIAPGETSAFDPATFLEEMDRIVSELAPGRQAVFVLADRANTATETHVFVLPDGHTTELYAVMEGGSHG